jgi:uncharacterized protein YciI
LDANPGALLAGGAQLPDDAAVMSGSILIVAKDDGKVAGDFIANAPFTKAGLVDSNAKCDV